MLTHPTLDQLRALRLDGMAEAFAELQARDGVDELPHADWLALLIDRELADRNTRRFRTRLRAAALRHAGAAIEDVDYRTARRLDRGLFVTELLGQGVNYVTGDYSRGATGFWVENGQIQYPVEEITIAGNLRQMLRDVAAVGADTLVRGGRRTGSILVAEMAVAGS